MPDSGGQDGSGLGLAIVREIATSCGAQVQLADRPDGAEGLVASVLFETSVERQSLWKRIRA